MGWEENRCQTEVNDISNYHSQTFLPTLFMEFSRKTKQNKAIQTHLFFLTRISHFPPFQFELSSFWVIWSFTVFYSVIKTEINYLNFIEKLPKFPCLLYAENLFYYFVSWFGSCSKDSVLFSVFAEGLTKRLFCGKLFSLQLNIFCSF